MKNVLVAALIVVTTAVSACGRGDHSAQVADTLAVPDNGQPSNAAKKHAASFLSRIESKLSGCRLSALEFKLDGANGDYSYLVNVLSLGGAVVDQDGGWVDNFFAITPESDVADGVDHYVQIFPSSCQRKLTQNPTTGPVSSGNTGSGTNTPGNGGAPLSSTAVLNSFQNYITQEFNAASIHINQSYVGLIDSSLGMIGVSFGVANDEDLKNIKKLAAARPNEWKYSAPFWIVTHNGASARVSVGVAGIAEAQ